MDRRGRCLSLLFMGGRFNWVWGLDFVGIWSLEFVGSWTGSIYGWEEFFVLGGEGSGGLGMLFRSNFAMFSASMATTIVLSGDHALFSLARGCPLASV